MRRLLLSLLVPIALLVVACGDDGGGTFAGGGDFCDLIRSFDEESGALDEIDSPQDLERAFNEVASRLDDAKGNAPGELRGDLDTLSEALAQFLGLLEEYDYDLFSLAVGAEGDPRVEALSDPEVEAASDRISAHCGIALDDEPTDFGGDPNPDFGDAPDFETPDFSEIEGGDAREISVQIYMSFGHDRDTAECLADEIGDFSEIGTDFGLDTTFCGLTVTQIVSGG